jgi:hypothetical protein
MHYEISTRRKDKFKEHAVSMSTVGEIGMTYQRLEPKAESTRGATNSLKLAQNGNLSGKSSFAKLFGVIGGRCHNACFVCLRGGD